MFWLNALFLHAGRGEVDVVAVSNGDTPACACDPAEV